VAARRATPGKGGRKATATRRATAAARHRGQRDAPPLTARGIGLVAGGLLLGVGAGITLERTLVRRDRRRDDPEAG